MVPVLVDTSCNTSDAQYKNGEMRHPAQDMDGCLKCIGLQNYRVQNFLCSSKNEYTALRGLAIMYWRFDKEQKAWFSFGCEGYCSTGGNNTDMHGMCHACCIANSNIKKQRYPWLYENASLSPTIKDILPSDDLIATAIRNEFSLVDHDPTGEYIQFLNSANLQKVWSILSDDMQQVQLDAKGCIFLSRCKGFDDEADNIGHMFITMSKFVSFCEKCSSARRNKSKRLLRKALNQKEQVKANS